MNPSESSSCGVFPKLPFWIAGAILGLAAFVVGPAVVARGGNEVKLPLPLRKPLDKLDREALGPYRFVTSQTMPAAVEDALGTHEYISWLLNDTSIKDKHNPLRRINLFVTYYTGGRNPVPHTPDQCYLGRGYQPIVKENLKVEMPTIGGLVPIRALTFEGSKLLGHEEITVVYLFHCNGRFVETRSRVRDLITSYAEKYAYFSKIEVTFGTGVNAPDPSRQDTIEAARKFLDRVLPVLVDEHFPDWEAVQRGAAEAVAAKS